MTRAERESTPPARVSHVVNGDWQQGHQCRTGWRWLEYGEACRSCGHEAKRNEAEAAAGKDPQYPETRDGGTPSSGVVTRANGGESVDMPMSRAGVEPGQPPASSPPPPAAAGLEPWWDSAGREVHWCPKADAYHGGSCYARHGIGTWTLPPGCSCVLCGHTTPKHPPESTTLPQDASGGFGTATETKTPSARKGEAVAATGEGAAFGPYAHPIGTVLGWEYGYEDHVCLNQSRYRLAPTEKCSLCGHVAAKEKSVFFKPPNAARPSPARFPQSFAPQLEDALANVRQALWERDLARKDWNAENAACQKLEAQLTLAREECERLKATLAREQAAENLWVKSLQEERDSLTEELKEFRRNGWHGDSAVEVVRIKRELEHERARHRDFVKQLESGKVVCYGGRKGFFYVQRTGREPQPKESLMRRLIKSAWKFVIVPGLVFSAAAHVVPLSRVYEAATFESRGEFHLFQVCAKCSASRGAGIGSGAVCPACGCRESSALVGREVTRAFLGVWPRETRWTAEGPVGFAAESGKEQR